MSPWCSRVHRQCTSFSPARRYRQYLAIAPAYPFHSSPPSHGRPSGLYTLEFMPSHLLEREQSRAPAERVHMYPAKLRHVVPPQRSQASTPAHTIHLCLACSNARCKHLMPTLTFPISYPFTTLSYTRSFPSLLLLHPPPALRRRRPTPGPQDAQTL